MLLAIQRIAERKIEQALRDGYFDDLQQWRNRPLPEDSMRNVPPNLRMAYRVLKNAGYVPEEVVLKKEIASIEEMLSSCTEEKQRFNQLKKLTVLKIKLEKKMGRALCLETDPTYHRKVVEKVSVKN